jgi:hypothetical protein
VLREDSYNAKAFPIVAVSAVILFCAGLVIMLMAEGSLEDQSQVTGRSWAEEEKVAAAAEIMLVVALVTAALLLAWGMYVATRTRRRPRRPRATCLACGYNLTGNVSGRCPECGCATESLGRVAQWDHRPDARDLSQQPGR